MKFIKLIQGTQPWLTWRWAGLGSSDTTIITEAPVPWKDGLSPRDLWLEKTGRVPERDSTYAMRRGSRLEPTVREWYQQRTGLDVPACCVEDEAFPWMRASLDGLDEWGELVLEIKCPRIESHEEALAGTVPLYYRSQCYWQLLITGASMLHYVSYSEKKGLPEEQRFALVEMKPDPDYQGWLLEQCAVFWMRVARNYWPETKSTEAPEKKEIPCVTQSAPLAG